MRKLSTAQGKRVALSRETRFPLPSPEGLAENRREAKKVVKQTAHFRWIQFIVAQQKFRRDMEKLANSDASPSPACTFWYHNDSRVTLFLVIIWSSFLRKPMSQAEIIELTGLSKPFVAKTMREGKEQDFLDQDGLMSEASIALWEIQSERIFTLKEMRDLGDSIAVLNIVEAKPDWIT